MVNTWTNPEVNGSIIPTRNYRGFTGPELKAGTTVVILHVHKCILGKVIQLSVRDPKTGKRFHKVPIDVFAR